MATPVRVGLMVPENNTTMEPELLGWLPAGSSCQTLRIPRGAGLLTPEAIPQYRESALQLARSFDSGALDVVAYGCTAAGFILGPEGDASIAHDLAGVTRLPVVTTAGAMVLGLQAMGARRIFLLTPYQDDVNRRIREFLGHGGIEVAGLDSFRAANVQELGAITSEQVQARALRAPLDGCDAMFIACSQLPTLTILETLTAALGVPVLSSIQATASRIMDEIAGRGAPLDAG